MVDNLSKFGSTVPLKSNNAQTIIDPFGNIRNSSRRKPNNIENDDGKTCWDKFYWLPKKRILKG